jgi:hypothetical protein
MRSRVPASKAQDLRMNVLLAAIAVIVAVLGFAVVGLFTIGMLVAVLVMLASPARPARDTDAVVTGFAWRRRVDIGMPQWAAMRSSARLRATNETQGLNEAPRSGDARPCTGEELTWRKMRHVSASGADQESLQWPDYNLAPGEQVRGESGVYLVMTRSPQGKRHTAKVGLDQWQSLKTGHECRLDGNALGDVRAIETASVPRAPRDPSAG